MKKRSLRFKLISLFILLMVINAGIVTWMLYHSLENELVSQDNRLLVNRADQLAKLIAGGIDIQTLPTYFQSMMDMRQDIIQITDATGHILVGSNTEYLDSYPLRLVNFEQLNINSINHWHTLKAYLLRPSILRQIHLSGNYMSC